MKKLLFVLASFIFTSSMCFAYDIDMTKDAQYQKKVMEMGFNILNANRIEKRVTFQYVNNKSPNALSSLDFKSVTILKGILPYLDNDAELAAILSHEIAHSVDAYGGYFRVIAMQFNSKKYEEKADKKAVDYMVKAGYNPVALIIALNKICEEPNNDILATHPKGSKRLTNIYEYIYKKYPAYLVQNEYKENVYYQNFLLTSRDAREKIREKHEIEVSNKTKKNL